jgi:hypothetical protein
MKEKNKEKEALAKKVAVKSEVPSVYEQIMDEKRIRISHPFYISFSLSYHSFKDLPFYIVLYVCYKVLVLSFSRIAFVLDMMDVSSTALQQKKSKN